MRRDSRLTAWTADFLLFTDAGLADDKLKGFVEETPYFSASIRP
jgi:hypothetical protein